MNQKILILVEKSVAKILHNYRENKLIFVKGSRGLHKVVQSCHFDFLEGKLEKPKVEFCHAKIFLYFDLAATVSFFISVTKATRKKYAFSPQVKCAHVN